MAPPPSAEIPADSKMHTAPAHPRRLVTSHNEKGEATFWLEGEIPSTSFYKGEEECAVFHVPWTTQGFPVPIQDTEDKAYTKNSSTLATKDGIVCRFVDFPPKTYSPMHRTVSLDYGVVIFGDLEMEVDNGELRKMTQSDVVVQRGTIHKWWNKSDKWARMMFILIASEPVQIDGKTLEGNM
ncbi:hypothetical protein QFC24_005141 [Naganishia onofrii]|uniref:Uncharacterized protein n=1 Tax=Naganishia onofrii TaxID=1851511 RepID=A0ACC2XA18_9TREE|nr:hypothetical protein QFC24_005141 [Naganishia onofrii]